MLQKRKILSLSKTIFMLLFCGFYSVGQTKKIDSLKMLFILRQRIQTFLKLLCSRKRPEEKRRI